MRRKLIRVGNSHCIVVPADYLKDLEQKYGKTIKEVNFTETRDGLFISPIAPAKESKE